MANPNVFAQFAQPVRSVVDYQNDYAKADALKNQNAMQSLALQQQQAATAQSLDERNALQRIAGGWNSSTTADQRSADLYNSGKPGLIAQGDALKKTAIDQQKGTAAAAKDQAEADAKTAEIKWKLADRHSQQLAFVQTPEDAAAYIDEGIREGSLPPQGRDRALAMIQQNGVAAWKQMAQQAAIPVVEKFKQDADMARTKLTTDTQIQTTGMNNATSRANVAATQAGENARSAATLGETQRHNGATEAQAGGVGGKMTEDQGKATGWLVQAENAFGNMQSAMKSTPSAAKPGFPDVVAAVPGLGGIANSMRGADRQKFMQGSSSLSEALLRAATGAGVNKDEAVQKIQELTPVFGEDPATTEQKMAAIPLYIESLKVRAGPGAPKAAAVLAGKGAPAPAASGGVPPDIQAILDRHGKK